jgi:hypothetical protein
VSGTAYVSQHRENEIYDGGMELLFSSLTVKIIEVAERAALEVVMGPYVHGVTLGVKSCLDGAYRLA